MPQPWPEVNSQDDENPMLPASCLPQISFGTLRGQFSMPIDTDLDEDEGEEPGDE